MKKIIDGKIYNTETATVICCNSYSNNDDFHYIDEALYVTKKGRYFLCGEGGPLSKYRVQIETNHWCNGEDIILMSREEARAYTEENGTVEEYIEFFGEPEEG